jgi:hypothetical protein
MQYINESNIVAEKRDLEVLKHLYFLASLNMNKKFFICHHSVKMHVWMCAPLVSQGLQTPLIFSIQESIHHSQHLMNLNIPTWNVGTLQIGPGT